MNFLECYSVKNSDLVKESYNMKNKRITINISKEKFEKLLYSFIELFEEPCFFILEVPLTLQEEKELQSDNPGIFHNNVYYIDGLTKEKLKALFSNHLHVFKNDGLISFGFASHFSHNEIFFTKYNIAYVYSDNIQKCLELLSTLDIPESKNFMTAWDTFDQETSGEAFDLNNNKNNVHTFVDYAIKHLEMYKGEIR